MKAATATKARKPRVKKSDLPVIPDSGRSPLEFWAGQFGTDYTARNEVRWLDRVPFFQHILEATDAQSFLDVGCNAGWNLRALRHLSAEFMMSGVDVNHDALAKAAELGFDVINAPADQVAATFGPDSADLVITSGVLIHIAPTELEAAMRSIVDVSSGYVLAVEYDAPEEQAIEYRGHAGRLWKRPFGKLYEALGLSLIEHGVAQGFVDCHYWLLQK